MKTTALIIAIAMLAVGLPTVGVADHGVNSNGDPCATDPNAIQVADLYVTTGPAVYQESNDVDGLQRGSDDSQVIPFFPDNGDCTHPDTIIV